MKEVIAFSMGDSTNPATWSNVPYFFLKNLEEQFEIEVHRVNIRLEDSSKLLRIISRIFDKTMRLIGAGSYCFNRTAFYDCLVKCKMKKALKKYPNSKLLITFDFSHSVHGGSSAKTLLFCDWTIEYLIDVLEKRSPNRIERRLIEKQNKVISNADYVVTIFPNAREYMQERTNNDVNYLGNVINSEVQPWPLEDVAGRRFNENNILFIGNRRYKDAAEKLICAVQEFNKKYSGRKYSVDIIGMTENELLSSQDVRYHGYLNKNDEKQREEYYTALKNAKMMVNTQDSWVGASSIIEGLYFGIPVIINPNDEIYKTFGENIEFGYYCESNSSKKLMGYIRRLDSLCEEQYREMAKNAQSAVKEFKWDSYIRKINALTEEKEDVVNGTD